MMAALNRRSNRLLMAALLVLYVGIYIVPLGLRPLSSPDEVRYGAISHEMIVSGNWVSPRFNGVRYFEKPIFGYWMNSASMSVLGENPFALRLPTALAAGLTALLVFALTARFATRFSAFLASGVYLTTFLVMGVGTTAVFDTFLTFFLAGTLASYYAALAEWESRQRNLYLLACGAFCAGAFLTKGFLGLVIPVLVAVPYLLLMRQWRPVLVSGWIPILTAACLIAPWAVWVHLREPDFWHYFFWIEHIQRFLGDDAQHAESFWYFFIYTPLAALPWIWTLPAAIVGLRKQPGERSFLLYLACWAVLPFLFFSASRGKLMTYVLPCFPALSILLAIGIENYLSSGRRRLWQLGAGVVAFVMFTALIALVLAQTAVFGDSPYGPDELLKLGFVVTCLAAGVGAMVIAAWSALPMQRLSATTVAGVVLFLPLQLGVPQSVLDNVAPQGFLDDDVLAGSDVVLVADSATFGSVAWYSKRDDIYVLSPGETAYGMAYPESRDRNLEDRGLADLIEANRGRREILIICRDRNEAQVLDTLPERAEREERGRVVLWRVPAE